MGYYTRYTLDINLDYVDEIAHRNQATAQTCACCGHPKAINRTICPECGSEVLRLNKEAIIADFRDHNGFAYDYLNENGESEEGAKWYDARLDVAEFSKRYPQVVFILDGVGEEANDIWRFYSRNGLGHLTQAKIVFEKYDDTKLKNLWGD